MNNTTSPTAHLSPAVQKIFSPKTIRSTAHKILSATISNGSNFFHVQQEKIATIAKFVSEITRRNYPNLSIPYHGRWNHFKVGTQEHIEKRISYFYKTLHGHGINQEDDQLLNKIDLIVISVLLDAGAGNTWKYQEQLPEHPHQTFERSEGLAIASLHLYLDKLLPQENLAQALIELTEIELKSAFQVNAQNPLLGISGRLHLLNELGQILQRNPTFSNNRPADILAQLIRTDDSGQKSICAVETLQSVLVYFSDLWPGRLKVDNTSVGDVWNHSQFGLVAFHKLSQWLTYSILQCCEHHQVRVYHIDEMTGLPEYRNGGLFLDGEVLKLKDPSLINKSWKVSDDLIIEWRALTVALLDVTSDAVRDILKLSKEQFPLAKVLEGGTWWAGRHLAKMRCPLSSPPLIIESDGTVF